MFKVFTFFIICIRIFQVDFDLVCKIDDSQRLLLQEPVSILNRIRSYFNIPMFLRQALPKTYVLSSICHFLTRFCWLASKHLSFYLASPAGYRRFNSFHSSITSIVLMTVGLLPIPLSVANAPPFTQAYDCTLSVTSM